MRYIVAIDGGGTKTHLGVFDTRGVKLFDAIGKGSNHAASDGGMFEHVIKGLYDEALKTLSIDERAIDYVYLGMSGADIESDFIKLNKACKKMFNTIPFTVVNDAWIMMRSGLKTPFGAVAISGTGTNSAAVNKQGNKAILRSLGYTLGIYGGGLDIAREALHYAFRDDELTYKKTQLKESILALFDVKDMDALVDLFYPVMKISKQAYGSITGLVFTCALKGDSVSQEILTRIGMFIGQQTAGVIKQVNSEKDAIPVVIGGRVFSGEESFLLNSFTTHLQKEVPKAYIVRPRFKPVVGAYLSALDQLNITQDEIIEENLIESGCGL